jgi:hypothetical protein
MEGTVSRLIQIYLESEKTLTPNVWLCTSEDRGNKRFWKKQFLRKDALAEEILTDIKSLLHEALDIAQSWKGTELEFAPSSNGTRDSRVQRVGVF